MSWVYGFVGVLLLLAGGDNVDAHHHMGRAIVEFIIGGLMLFIALASWVSGD